MKQRFINRARQFFRRLHGILTILFAAQRQVVDHPARLKAVLTPRRAGKTMMACAWLLSEAKKHPGAKLLYVALTRPNAKDIAWEMFKVLDKRYRLGAHFQKSELEITLPNGAKILLRGADQENWIKKLEGQEFLLIIVDESGLYEISVRNLVYDSLKPMVDSCGGTLVLIGRPGIVKIGLFWDITRPDKRKEAKGADGAWVVTDKKGASTWAVFNWSTLDNPHVAERWRKEIEDKIRINPDIVHDPGFRRNYLGEWADGGEGMVYSFSEANIIESYEPMGGDEFGCTFDCGWDDAQAFMVGCWNPRRAELVILESFKKQHMPLNTPPNDPENQGAIQRMESYQRRYPGLRMWGDPAKKQLFMEFANRFGQCVNPAQKEEKHDNIELMNNDWTLRKILVVRATNQQFIDEVQALKKHIEKQIADAALGGEERPGDWKEHPRLANDLCDCGLYLWRHSMHYRFEEPEEHPKPGTPEALEAEIAAHWESERQKAAERQQHEWWHGQ